MPQELDVEKMQKAVTYFVGEHDFSSFKSSGTSSKSSVRIIYDANVEKELIRIYNPPLNLQGNFNKTNLDFRKELSALRSCTSAKQAPIPNNQLKLNTYPQQLQCSNCGINLTIDEGLKNEKYIKCLSCGCIIQNPIYIQNKKNKERRQWIAVLIFLVVVIIFNISSREYSTSSKGNNRIENYGSNKGPSQTKAMAGVRVYLKRHYLKDPDSYECMDMGKIGIVTPMSKALVETVKRATDGEFPTDSINSKLEQIKAMFENKGINPYDTLAWEISHRYRAKNSYGGYAITNCTYHFNKDISDIISVETK